MLTTAWRELRAHPGRFAATLVAIVVAVGFLAAAQVFAATEASAMAARQALYASRADVVVQTHLWNSGSAVRQRDIALETAEAAVRGSRDVVAAERFSQLEGQVSLKGRYSRVMLNSTVGPALRWYRADEGRLPEAANETVLNRDTAEQLGARVGDTITVDVPHPVPLVVVGISDQRGYADPPVYLSFAALQAVAAQSPFAVPGVIVDLKAAARKTPGSSGPGIGVVLLVRTAPGKGSAVAAATQRALDEAGVLHIYAVSRTATSVRDDAVREVAAAGDWRPLFLAGASVVAVVVGAMIIGNTYRILIAQRRRQIGLLRAVGATRGQVVSRFLAEALLLGVLGSVVGVALGVAAGLVAAAATRALELGAVVSWPVLGAILLLGIVGTVAAALLPIRAAIRVRPLESLQPATGVGRRPLHRALLAAGSAGLAVLGLVAAGLALATGRQRLAVPLAAAGAVLLLAGVLASSSLLVPALVRVVAAPFVRRPVVGLAVGNAVRNPHRTAAAATALLLAMGVIATVQVGAASGRASAFRQLDERYPADLTLVAAPNLPDLVNPNGSGPTSTDVDADGYRTGFRGDAIGTVRRAPGVRGAFLSDLSEPLLVAAGFGRVQLMPLVPLTPELNALLSMPQTIPDDTIGLPADVLAGLKLHPGDLVQLQPFSQGRARTVRVMQCDLAATVGVVSPATLAAIGPHLARGLIVAQLERPDDAGTVIAGLDRDLRGANPTLAIDGAAERKASLRALLDGVTLFATALLAVAAVVALVGVGNTLGLAVLERRREIGLLRALGVGRGEIVAMLVIEAALLSVVAVALGLVLGVGFGWLGARALTATLGLPPPPLALAWGRTLITALVVWLFGALASVIPGRAAARTPPVAALADVG